jgi:RNA polymerase sigma-70 factor (ECF subfamily)
MPDHPPPSPDQGTSLTLLRRLRDDDPDAWSLMVRLYTPLVRRWGERGGVRGADLDDLSQEVFRTAVGGLKNFRRERPGETFRGWLHGITRNFLLKHFERQRRSPQAAGGSDAYFRLQELPLPTEETADDISGDKQALYLQALELMKDRFEDKTWRAFWLTVIDGLGPAEVAGWLGVSAAAVRKYKSRVLHCLRSELGDLLE